MKDGFFRVAAASPEIRVGDCAGNGETIGKTIKEAAEKGAQAIVFPELSLTGATCGDLFRQQVLLSAAEDSLCNLIRNTAELSILAAVGLPVRVGAAVYDCAAVFSQGILLGLSAKVCISYEDELSRGRYFLAAPECSREVSFAGFTVPLGKDLLFAPKDMPDCKIAVTIGDDDQALIVPSAGLTAAGATVILNCSAEGERVGRADFRRKLAEMESARLICGYAGAFAGLGESTTDMVFSGHCFLAENGRLIAESALFEGGMILADLDTELLSFQRSRNTGWASGVSARAEIITFSLPEKEKKGLLRKVRQLPFVPDGEAERKERCEFLLTMQAEGLRTRLAHTGCRQVVIGVSGGLDSTLAILVAVRAFKKLGLSPEGILAVSMPGFGTTGRTKSNAQKLAECCGAQFREIPIGESVNLHFRDIGHDPEKRDVTYENAQARERTQVLMDLANEYNGMVIGTGDLSELALGWATYNGDHMSMYAVNAAIPKTLVRHLVRYEAEKSGGQIKTILEDVLDTPVSPELLPPVNGVIAQKTEDIVGPYELHDFFLYYLVRYGFGPGKIFRLALHAFENLYDRETVLKWLKIFCRRFFTQQFKRSCLPDGPKVGSVGVSPRGDWRMPSDASSAVWMAELEKLS